MSKDPIVSIIIVSYNTCEMTLEAIRSAQEQTKAVCEFIVVDNASEDGSADAIGKTFPHIKLLAEKVNHGFAKANNIAAKHATGEFLLLLNPDTVTLDGAIDKLIAFAERRPEAKIWGGRTLYGDMSLNTTNCWNHMTVWSLFCSAFGLSKLFHGSSFFNPEGYGNWDRSTERDVGFVTGCFLMIRREFWNALEGFDLSFKMYGEEADLALRAQQKGAKPRVTPDATIIHFVGASSKQEASKLILVLKAKSTLIRRYFNPYERTIGISLLYLQALVRVPFSRSWRKAWSARSDWIPGYSVE